jgi:hypothetical protein
MQGYKGTDEKEAQLGKAVSEIASTLAQNCGRLEAWTVTSAR